MCQGAEDVEMARVNLTINDNLFEKIQSESEERGVSANNLIYNIIVKHFDDTGFDLLDEFENMKKEAKEKAKETNGKFSYNDLPTYQNLEEKLGKSKYPESVKQVKIRLSMMFRESDCKTNDWIFSYNGKTTLIESKDKNIDEINRLLQYYD